MVVVRRVHSAFTLIELLLVMVILVVLSGIAVPIYTNHAKNSRIKAARASIAGIETAVSTFQVDCGRFPSNDEGLDVLVRDPGIEGWSGPYLKLVKSDPWGNAFIYEAPGTNLPALFDLYSMGPDKQAGNSDDIVNWQD